MSIPTDEYERAQAKFAALAEPTRKDTHSARAALTREIGFVSTPRGEEHFLTHPREYPSTEPQLSAVLDTHIAAHPIFAEFDADTRTRWRLRTLRSRVTVQTTVSFSLPLLCAAIEAGRPYADLARTHKASPRDGNTLGNYPGNYAVVPRGPHSEATQRSGARKTKRLSPQSAEKLERHRHTLSGMGSALERMRYARAQGLIDVTLEDGTEEKIHLLGGRPRPDGGNWYFPFSVGMTLEKLLASALGVDPASYIMSVDQSDKPLLTQTPKSIDAARLVRLIGNSYGEGLHRGNVLERIAAHAPAVIGFRDGDPRNLRLENQVVGILR